VPQDVREARAAADQRQQVAIKRSTSDLERMQTELAKVLPSYVSPERMVRIATSAIRKNPDLAECSAVSLGGAVLMAATLGLEMNTPTGEAYLIPRRESGVMEATMQVGYQGWTKLWWQHPRAGKLAAVAVYPGDEFAWQLGTHPEIHHVPRPERRDPEAEPTHYYATATLLGSTDPEFEVMTAAEVFAIRGKVGPQGKIADPQRWMERKVPLRQLLKIMPKSTTAALAVSSDDRSGRELLPQAAERVQAERVDQQPETAEGANGSEWPATRPIPVDNGGVA
jgi:recombination protein RecT